MDSLVMGLVSMAAAAFIGALIGEIIGKESNTDEMKDALGWSREE